MAVPTPCCVSGIRGGDYSTGPICIRVTADNPPKVSVFPPSSATPEKEETPMGPKCGGSAVLVLVMSMLREVADYFFLAVKVPSPSSASEILPLMVPCQGGMEKFLVSVFVANPVEDQASMARYDQAVLR